MHHRREEVAPNSRKTAEENGGLAWFGRVAVGAMVCSF